jgi:hypothetical protein
VGTHGKPVPEVVLLPFFSRLFNGNPQKICPAGRAGNLLPSDVRERVITMGMEP